MVDVTGRRQSKFIVDRRAETEERQKLNVLKREHFEKTRTIAPQWATTSNADVWFGKTPERGTWPMEKPRRARQLDMQVDPARKRASQILGKLGSKE